MWTLHSSNLLGGSSTKTTLFAPIVFGSKKKNLNKRKQTMKNNNRCKTSFISKYERGESFIDVLGEVVYILFLFSAGYAALWLFW
jgi:hypothetical protein